MKLTSTRFLPQSCLYPFTVFYLLKLPIQTRDTRKLFRPPRSPSDFQTALWHFRVPGISLSGTKPQRSLGMHLPERSGAEFVKWVPGRSRALLRENHGAVQMSESVSALSEALLRTPCASLRRAGSHAPTLQNLRQAKGTMALNSLHSMPWALGWTKRKRNVFTMPSKLSSNHSNLGFPPNLVQNSEWPDRNKSLSFCSSVVSHKGNRTNLPGVRPINQQRKQLARMYRTIQELVLKAWWDWIHRTPLQTHSRGAHYHPWTQGSFAKSKDKSPSVNHRRISKIHRTTWNCVLTM